MKNTSSTPAVPAPSGRSAAPSAESTPSSASALASSPPSASCASTIVSESRSAAPNRIGATVLALTLDPGATKNGHVNARNAKHDAAISADRRAPADADRAGIAHQCVTGSDSVRNAPASRSCSTVSQGSGARILATCGAKRRRRDDDVARRAVGDDLAFGHHDDAIGRAGDELDVVGRDDDGVPGRGELAEHAREVVLGVVVEPAGRLVEQDDIGRGRELDREHEREPLTFREIARMRVVGDAGEQRVEDRARSTGRRGRFGVGLRELGADRVEIEEVGRCLRHEADERARVLGGARRAGRPPRRRPRRGRSRACPVPCSAHSNDDLPEPLRPISATTSPLANSRSTSRTATTASWRTTMPRARSNGRPVRCAVEPRRWRDPSRALAAAVGAARRASRIESGSGSQPAARPRSMIGGTRRTCANIDRGSPTSTDAVGGQVQRRGRRTARRVPGGARPSRR